MSALLLPLLGEFLKEIVLPVVGSILLGYGVIVAAKIKEKTGVDVTEKLNGLLNRAIARIAESLIAQVSSGSLTFGDHLIDMGVSELEKLMPDTLTKLGASRGQLMVAMRNALNRKDADPPA